MLTFAPPPASTPRTARRSAALATALAGLLQFTAAGMAMAADAPAAAASAAPGKAARPALTVTTTTPQRGDWPMRLVATGNIAPWQEAVISTEAAGLRLVAVSVNVGDRVQRGQLLAKLATETLSADREQTRASLAEAQAMLVEAKGNADRARELLPSGMISTQQANQWLTAEQTAHARLAALKARLKADDVRLAQTRIVAPDDGIISARSATVGAVAQPGQELFRLIRRERLEWRAEVPEADLGRIKPGQAVKLSTPDGQQVRGTVRTVAPTVDAQRRNGLVYVDLAADAQTAASARAGMFARGEFELGSAPGLTLPQSALVLRDGFNVVLRVGADGRVTQTKVVVGRRIGERVEIVSGLDPAARVVASGAAFLADGDLVRVVQAAPADARPAPKVDAQADPPAGGKRAASGKAS